MIRAAIVSSYLRLAENKISVSQVTGMMKIKYCKIQQESNYMHMVITNILHEKEEKIVFKGMLVAHTLW